jgi:hypothetical protein
MVDQTKAHQVENIRTPRLILRQLRLSDAVEIYNIASFPEVRQWRLVSPTNCDSTRL